MLSGMTRGVNFGRAKDTKQIALLSVPRVAALKHSPSALITKFQLPTDVRWIVELSLT